MLVFQIPNKEKKICKVCKKKNKKITKALRVIRVLKGVRLNSKTEVFLPHSVDFH